MDMFYAMNFMVGLFGVIVLAMTYSYIDKMERIGCACSAYKYRGFIKTWSLIAIGAILVMMFAPVKLVHQMSSPLGKAYAGLSAVFWIMHLVYIALALAYVDHLMKEKCKCSEDKRRELLYYWFWLRVLVIFGTVLVNVIVPLSMTSVANINHEGRDILMATVNPVAAIRKLPKSVKKLSKKM